MRFLVDENFNNEIVRGVLRRVPDGEMLRIQDMELAGEPDDRILEWAVQHGYMVISHDVSTMRDYFYQRLDSGLPVPGLFLIHLSKPIGVVIDSLELILLASEEHEWVGGLHYLPFEQAKSS